MASASLQPGLQKPPYSPHNLAKNCHGTLQKKECTNYEKVDHEYTKIIFSQFTRIHDPLISWNIKCAEVCHIYSISYQAFKGGKIQSLRLCIRVQTFLWWCSHSSKMGNRARPEALLSRPADMHFTFIGAALIHCHASWKKRDSRVEATRSSLYYVKCALGVLLYCSCK